MGTESLLDVCKEYKLTPASFFIDNLIHMTSTYKGDEH